MTMFTRIKKLSGISILALALALVAVAGDTGSAQEGQKGLQVTVLLYSGRPNPSFIMNDKESIDMIKDLVAKSTALKAFKKKTVLPSILGYNGVVVENLDGTVEQFPASLVIYKGSMEVMNKEKKFLNDEGNKLESFLLSKAVDKKVIDESAFKKIKAEKQK